MSPSVEDSVLKLEAPETSPITVDLSKLGDRLPAIIWEKPVAARDCGDEVAHWLSRVLLQQDVGIRLVYYPENKPKMKLRERDKVFPFFDKADTVSSFYYSFRSLLIMTYIIYFFFAFDLLVEIPRMVLSLASRKILT